jgi:hypothetical protein
MSVTTIAQKVSAEHLARAAYLYVRQSTLRQVQTNTESAEHQYALRQRAVQLGWAAEQIVVIDTDQGQSGASSSGREGFQRLVAEVGLGKAGIVLGLEVSRLARNNADWHRLAAGGHSKQKSRLRSRHRSLRVIPALWSWHRFPMARGPVRLRRAGLCVGPRAIPIAVLVAAAAGSRQDRLALDALLRVTIYRL